MEVREPIAVYGKRKLTIAEYLEYESTEKEKHEYYQGEIFSMAGAKLIHNTIAMNLAVSLGIKLKGKSCRPYNGDQRIHIPENTLFTYPDISVFCGEVITLNNDEWNALNPRVLIEVLSPSTRNYDSVTKFGLYKAIPTFKEYVLIDSEAIHAEVFHLNYTQEWVQQEYTSINDTIELSSIKVSVSMQEIYEGTKLLSHP